MKGKLAILFVPLFLLASCGGYVSGGTQIVENPDTESTSQQSNSIVTGTAFPSQNVTPSVCPSVDGEKIGQSIAESYVFTTTEEVMTWFCEGAEFEDILVALETEEHTGTTAEDMLAMRAEGLSWEEIWLVVGFTEE